MNLGPLRFHSELARSYTIEEVMDLVGASGFEVASQDRQELPYFHSPVTGSRRTDVVFRFAARKTAEVGEVRVPETLPPWVANPLLPIPITPALIALGRTSMFTTGVLSMINGERSIVDVARELAAGWGVEPATAPRRAAGVLGAASRSLIPSLREVIVIPLPCAVANL